MSDGLHVVHVRVVDSASGRPTPVRMSFRSPDGRVFAPLGRSTQFPVDPSQDVGLHVKIGTRAFAYVDGSCEILLPATPFDLKILKGPQFLPLQQTVTLGPGKMALRFVLERRDDPPARGWYAGDCRCHELSPHAVLLEGAAEGLAVVNLLARQRLGQAIPPNLVMPGLEAFSGQEACLTSPESTVVVNTFNVHTVLGSLSLLACHRPIFPLVAGAEGFEDWTLGDWCGQCHRKKGLVIWSEPSFWSDSLHECPAPEGLAQLLLGDIDAIEISGSVERLGSNPWTNWYALLNAGFRMPIAGASGKESNGQQIGSCRTYARLEAGAPLSYLAWVEAVRAGKTVVSDGPLLEFQVNDGRPGDEVSASAADPRLRIKAEANCMDSTAVLELIGDGEVLATHSITSPGPVSFSNEIAAADLHWLAARLRRDDGSFLAHTSPIYIANHSSTHPRFSSSPTP